MRGLLLPPLTSAEAMKVSATGRRRGSTALGNSVQARVSTKTKNSNSMIHHCVVSGRAGWEEAAGQQTQAGSGCWKEATQGMFCNFLYWSPTQYSCFLLRWPALHGGAAHLVLELEPGLRGVADDVSGLLHAQSRRGAEDRERCAQAAASCRQGAPVSAVWCDGARVKA